MSDVRPVVVTRHAALVEYLRERYPALVNGADVLTHVENPARQIEGRVVVGVLPMHLAAWARLVVEIPLALGIEDRGRELDLARVREIAGEPVAYTVQAQPWRGPARRAKLGARVMRWMWGMGCRIDAW